MCVCVFYLLIHLYLNYNPRLYFSGLLLSKSFCFGKSEYTLLGLTLYTNYSYRQLNPVSEVLSSELFKHKHGILSQMGSILILIVVSDFGFKLVEFNE